jgi:hypothetical protein
MKRVIIGAILLIVGGLALWMGLYPTDWTNWLGFSRADYFVHGQNYAFASGPGPMFLTAAGMSTIIIGLWHSINCHEEGCYRIGRHKINGTPWCNWHHDNARHHRSLEEIMEEQVLLLRELLARQ